jgi:hypothetical protein
VRAIVIVRQHLFVRVINCKLNPCELSVAECSVDS